MGSFDEVTIRCKSCGARGKFQSKAGECEYNEYTLMADRIPAGILGDLQSRGWCCDECGTNHTFNVQTIVTYETDW